MGIAAAYVEYEAKVALFVAAFWCVVCSLGRARSRHLCEAVVVCTRWTHESEESRIEFETLDRA